MIKWVKYKVIFACTITGAGVILTQAINFCLLNVDIVIK